MSIRDRLHHAAEVACKVLDQAYPNGYDERRFSVSVDIDPYKPDRIGIHDLTEDAVIFEAARRMEGAKLSASSTAQNMHHRAAVMIDGVTVTVTYLTPLPAEAREVFDEATFREGLAARAAQRAVTP